MRRSERLSAPAASFAVVGMALLIFGAAPAFQMRGGLTTSGGYALALQIVLALVLLGGVDELSRPLIVTSTRNGRRTPDPGRPLFDMRRALARHYLSRPVPAFFLALGFSVSLATVLIGLLDHPDRRVTFGSVLWMPWSELASASILVVATLVQIRRPRPGFLGWCPGFAVGSALTQVWFDADAEAGLTSLTWLGLALLLSVLWVLAGAAMALRHRRV